MFKKLPIAEELFCFNQERLSEDLAAREEGGCGGCEAECLDDIRHIGTCAWHGNAGCRIDLVAERVQI